MKKIAFISDYFIQDGIGGAELTTDAIIKFGAIRQQERAIESTHWMAQGAAGFDIGSVHCNKINVDIMKNSEDEDLHFIVCNFLQLQDDVKLYMIKNCSYSIVEYDYKICKYRSFELHEINEGKPCDCETTTYGKINSAFYGYADKVWFMSEKQRDKILAKVPVLKKENTEVLSSVFSLGDLRFIQSIKDNEKDENYIILDSESPVKGTQECIQYAQDNDLKYELIRNLPYHELLIKLSMSKGLIFRPVASDTCPRLVIEAMMLGCDLHLNEHVQHKDEEWFANQESCYQYLLSRADAFWSYYE
jgi:hypothetical protein